MGTGHQPFERTENAQPCIPASIDFTKKSELASPNSTKSRNAEMSLSQRSRDCEHDHAYVSVRERETKKGFHNSTFKHRMR